MQQRQLLLTCVLVFLYRNPHITAVRGFLEDQALRRLAASGTMLTFDEWCPSYNHKPQVGPQYDGGASDDDSYMRGVGKKLNRLTQEQLDLIDGYLKEHTPDCWPHALPPRPNTGSKQLPAGTVCYEHAQAQLRGAQTATSAGHASETRDSTYVVVRCACTGTAAYCGRAVARHCLCPLQVCIARAGGAAALHWAGAILAAAGAA